MKKNNIQYFVNVNQCKTLNNNIDKFLIIIATRIVEK